MAEETREAQIQIALKAFADVRSHAFSAHRRVCLARGTLEELQVFGVRAADAASVSEIFQFCSPHKVLLEVPLGLNIRPL